MDERSDETRERTEEAAQERAEHHGEAIRERIVGDDVEAAAAEAEGAAEARAALRGRGELVEELRGAEAESSAEDDLD